MSWLTLTLTQHNPIHSPIHTNFSPHCPIFCEDVFCNYVKSCEQRRIFSDLLLLHPFHFIRTLPATRNEGIRLIHKPQTIIIFTRDEGHPRELHARKEQTSTKWITPEVVNKSSLVMPPKWHLLMDNMELTCKDTKTCLLHPTIQPTIFSASAREINCCRGETREVEASSTPPKRHEQSCKSVVAAAPQTPGSSTLVVTRGRGTGPCLMCQLKKIDRGPREIVCLKMVVGSHDQCMNHWEESRHLRYSGSCGAAKSIGQKAEICTDEVRWTASPARSMSLHMYLLPFCSHIEHQEGIYISTHES